MASGREIRAGRAYVELSTRDKLTAGLNAAQKRLEAFGSTVRAVGARLFAVGAAGTAAFLPSIAAASDLEETMAKFDVVFGDQAKTVKAWGDQFANQVGRSKKQIAEFMAGTQDLFVPLGFEPGAATELSKQVTGLAIDLASFNNKTDTDAMNDLQAALTGSGEVMKKYGVIVSEAAVKQELLNQGIDPKNVTEQQKVMGRLAIIMRGTTAAQGDAVRSGQSHANQVKRTTGEIFDMSAAIGTALLPVVTPLVAKVGQVARLIADWAAQNKPLVATIFKVAAIVAGIGAALVTVGLAAAAAGAALSGMATLITFAGAAFAAIKVAVLAILSPLGLASVAVIGLGAAVAHVTGFIPAAISYLGDRFKDLKGFAVEAFKGISAALAGGDIKLAAKVLWLALKLAWQNGISALETEWANFKLSFLTTANDAFYSVARIATEAVALVQSAWADTRSFFGKLWGEIAGGAAIFWAKQVKGAAIAAAHIRGFFDESFNVEAATKKAEAEFGAEVTRIIKEVEQTQKQINKDRDKQLARIEAERKATQKGIDTEEAKERTKRETERDAELAATEAALANARTEYQKALDQAKGTAPAGGEPGSAPSFDGKKFLDQLRAGAASAAGGGNVRGTFNAAAIQSLQSTRNEERIAEATENTARNTAWMRTQLAQFGRFA